MAQNVKSKDNFLKFRGKPLVRSGNTIYYGDMSDPYVAMLQIESVEQFEDLELAKGVSVQILSTDASKSPKERIIKKTNKATLYDAIQIASIWLERTLRDAQ